MAEPNVAEELDPKDENGRYADEGDLYFPEEREGARGRPSEGRRSLSEIQTLKMRAGADRRQKLWDDRQKRMADQAEITGFTRPEFSRTIMVRPTDAFRVNGVNDESGGRIVGDTEVELTTWISRRIRDGSLELVGEGERSGAEPRRQRPRTDVLRAATHRSATASGAPARSAPAPARACTTGTRRVIGTTPALPA